jgi:hypothetical protein
VHSLLGHLYKTQSHRAVVFSFASSAPPPPACLAPPLAAVVVVPPLAALSIPLHLPRLHAPPQLAQVISRRLECPHRRLLLHL